MSEEIYEKAVESSRTLWKMIASDLQYLLIKEQGYKPDEPITIKKLIEYLEYYFSYQYPRLNAKITQGIYQELDTVIITCKSEYNTHRMEFDYQAIVKDIYDKKATLGQSIIEITNNFLHQSVKLDAIKAIEKGEIKTKEK
jgi:hypothetical protein